MKNNKKLCMFTDENLNGITKKLDLKDKDVLTVTSSGDQALNFILAGAKNVKLFDKNVDTEKYFYLKKALIENLNYQEFLDFFIPGLFNKKAFLSKEKYNFSKSSLPFDEVRMYWDFIFNNCSSQEIKDIFALRKYSKKDLASINNYLSSEQNYNQLKEKLKDIDVLEFEQIDILKELLYVKDKVDFIYLSNLLNYIPATDQKEFLKKIKALALNISMNLTDNGVLAVSYMHCYLDDYWYNLGKNIQSIISRPEYSSDFLKKDCDLISFKGGYIPSSNRKKDRDCLLLYENSKTKKKVKSK